MHRSRQTLLDADFLQSAARLPLPLSLLCAAVLAGCATPLAAPDLAAAPQPRQEAWAYAARPAGSAAGAAAERGSAAAPAPASALSPEAVPRSWWAVFNDPVLAQLQTDASAGSLDLQAAWLRIEESQARLGLTAASSQPQFGLGADATRAAISADSPLAKLGAPTTPYNQWQLGGQVSWELDLWGHLRQQTEAAREQWAATQWGAQAARTTLAAEVARHYLLLRGVQAQQGLMAEGQRIAAELLRLAESRARNGMATRSEVAAARAELASLQAKAQQLEHQRDVTMNALALLLGQPPHQLDALLAPTAALPRLPAHLPVGVPSELARRRPDILQAEATLRAATAEVGAAQADFYPRIGLNAALGLAAFQVSELSSWDARQFGFGPVVHLPIFDGGRLQRTLDLTQARQRGAALAWRQTVLRAWHEVTDALDASASEQARRAQLEQAAQFSEEALASARSAWKAGQLEFNGVLQAERQLLGARGALVDNATASGLAVVALYRALGGGADGDALAGAPRASAAAAVAETNTTVGALR